jgi:hypothetical protein
MTRCSKVSAPVIPFLVRPLFSQPPASLARQRSISHSWKFEGLFRRLISTSSYPSTATSHSDEDSRDRNFQYNWIDGAESLEKYKPGGYHPIMIGDILHKRYRVVDKLGFGGYSTVWLAHDIDEFAVKGPNGAHPCYKFVLNNND